MEQRSSRLQTLAWGFLLIGLVACFWTFRMLLAGTEFPGWGDPLIYFYPHYEATFGTLARGSLPIWNPYQLCGVPWLAALQAGVFYPPHLLYVLLPTHVAMAASNLLHLLLVGVSMAAFARRAGLAWPAALLAAALGTMRGWLPNEAIWPTVVEAGAWLAPGALGLLGLARGGGPRSIAWLALATAASLLAGQPQYTVYNTYAWAVLLGVLLLHERSPLTGWLRAGGSFLAAIALGGLLAAVQIVPSFELAAHAIRNLEGLARPEMFPFGVAGSSLASAAKQILSSEGNDLALSFGVSGLALLPFSLLSRRHRALALGTIGLGCLALTFAMGPATPLFELYVRLPALDSFRLPNRILFVCDFCFAVAAAVGLEELRRRVSQGAWASPRVGSAVAALVVAMALGELFGAAPKRPQMPYFKEGYVLLYHRPREVYSRIAASRQRVLLWNPGLLPTLPSKLASVFGMRAVDDYEPMSLRRQAEYFGFLNRGKTKHGGSRQRFSGRLFLPARAKKALAFASRQRLLDLAAVRFVLAPAPLLLTEGLQSYVKAAGLERSGHRHDGLVLFENPRALPRAFVTYRVRRAPPAEKLLAELSRSDFDPLVESYVDGDAGLGASGDAPPRGKPVAILRDESTLVEIEAELEAPGLLVLADSYYPAWRATVDGEPVEILPTNHLFRGVPLRAGRHVVRFEYGSGLLMLGAAASAVGLAALALLLRSGRARPEGQRARGARRPPEWTSSRG